ncbi:hypothetical protein COLO4_21266 [Corchorus olitorius]|uniref:PRP1 splicing factor N-terminal domain-containing protein n=1 Tax=Corchorus olitorius TaxID=93759 RepID=A0A1R3IUJ5_9ROSI|nr:hypothetical protein COLO4_21266 [Corchorus olitorius]
MKPLLYFIPHVPLRGGTQPGPGGATPPKPRLDFLNSNPLPNYVAGLGRDATGFTTRSDIGPAHAAPDLPDRSAARNGGVAPASGLAMVVGSLRKMKGMIKVMTRTRNLMNLTGNDVGLFASADYDEDDKKRWGKPLSNFFFLLFS